MITLNIENYGIYKNSILDIPFNHDEFISRLKGFVLRFDKTRTAETFPAPSMSWSYYDYILEYQVPPSQEEYCEYFISKNNTEIMAKITKNPIYKDKTQEILQGLKARAARSYPSLVRDLHFSLFLQKEGFDVFWNPLVDVDCKVDVALFEKKQLYGIALYTDTKWGQDCRARKLTESKMPKEFRKVELPLLLNEGDHIGDFLLYGKSQMEELKRMIA